MITEEGTELDLTKIRKLTIVSEKKIHIDIFLNGIGTHYTYASSQII